MRRSANKKIIPRIPAKSKAAAHAPRLLRSTEKFSVANQCLRILFASFNLFLFGCNFRSRFSGLQCFLIKICHNNLMLSARKPHLKPGTALMEGSLYKQRICNGGALPHVSGSPTRNKKTTCIYQVVLCSIILILGFLSMPSYGVNKATKHTAFGLSKKTIYFIVSLLHCFIVFLYQIPGPYRTEGSGSGY